MYSLPFCLLLFTFLRVSLKTQKFLLLMKLSISFNLSIFVAYTLGSYVAKSQATEIYLLFFFFFKIPMSRILVLLLLLQRSLRLSSFLKSNLSHLHCIISFHLSLSLIIFCLCNLHSAIDSIQCFLFF